MARFQYEPFEVDGMLSYRYVGDGSVVGRSWPGLAGEWPEGPTPMSEFNVTSNNAEEVAVYLGFVWELCRGRSVYAIPCGAGAYVAHALSGEYDLVKWEFDVELEEGSKQGDLIGFLPARTSTHWLFDATEAATENSTSATENSTPPNWLPETAASLLKEMEELEELEDLTGFVAAGMTPDRPPGWRVEWDTHAALYPVRTFEALRAVQEVTLGNAASSVNVFAVGAGRRAHLAEALRADTTPKLADVLAPGEIFVSLNLGIDMGYVDVLVVQATIDLAEEIGRLTAAFDQRIAAYEASVDQIADMPGFLTALERLAGLGDG